MGWGESQGSHRHEESVDHVQRDAADLVRVRVRVRVRVGVRVRVRVSGQGWGQGWG